MNMSDDVVSTTLSVTQTAAQTGGKVTEKTIDIIGKLLEALLNDSKQRAAERAAKRAAKQQAKATDLTDIKPGTVSMKELVQNARKTGDTLSTAEQGLTKADQKYITRKAREYGIPVAFTGSEGKDNLYASVRTSDLPVFQRICTEMMQEKIAEHPEKLGNFKVNEWEVPFITAELNKHDLSASFGKTKDGESFCLYEKGDEKAILIARGEFVRKCSEVEQNMQFSRDDAGFYHIQDNRSGQEITFDELPTREVLAAQMQDQFNLEESTAKIACAKFGEEMLHGQEKQRFFADNPQDAFSRVDANIHVEGEQTATKAYDCWRMTPKTDDVPRIVFRDQEGKFSVLQPEKMTQFQMAKQLKTDLGIQDNAEVMALVDKARKVSDYYVTQQNTELSYEFKKTDFDMKNPDVVSGMLRTDEDGNTFAKSLPISSIDNQIERTGKGGFTVTITGTAIETDQNGVKHPMPQTQTLELSFSDKKHALHEMTALYKQQGVPDHIAGAMAKDVFRMASEQSAEKVLLVEEVKTNAVTISQGIQTVEVPTEDPAAAVKEIAQKFDVSEQQAETVLAQADEQVYPLTAEDLDHFAIFSEDAAEIESDVPFVEETPIVEEAVKPVAAATPELVSEVVPEAVVEEAPQPVAEVVPQPVIEEAPQPVAEEAPQPVVEEAPQPVAEVVPEPFASVEPEPVTVAATEPVLTAAQEPVAETPKPDVSAMPEPVKPMEPASTSKPLSEGMQFLTGKKKLDGVTFLRLDTSAVGTGEIFLKKASTYKKAQFIMLDDKVYLNPMFKGSGALQGFGQDVRKEAFDQGVGTMFDLPALSVGIPYSVEDMRPATVTPKGNGFEILKKGSVDVKIQDTDMILKAPAPKLPEFPKPELPAFRR